MLAWSRKDVAGAKWSWPKVILVGAGLTMGIVPVVVALAPRDGGAPAVAAYVRSVSSAQPTYLLSTRATHRSAEIPAFARKYGLACSAATRCGRS